MSVLGQLASASGNKNEIPNQELASRVADRNDHAAVKELVDNLANKDKGIQSDCIKVLYEIGFRKPSLIADYWKEFVALLKSKNNRLVWGAMMALDTIVPENPKAIYGELPAIQKAVQQGSVITRDHYVGILTKLSSMKEYSAKTFPLLLDQLKVSPVNQLPKYAEDAVSVVDPGNSDVFLKTVKHRLPDIDTDSKRKRLEKVIRKLEKSI